MFFEWIEFIRQPSSKFARRMGYVYSTIALEWRQRRQKHQWQHHVHACADMWRQIITEHSPKKIAILGSGPLHEIPIDWLLDQVDEIHLVDVVQPRSVRRRYSHNTKVHLVEKDLTGLVDHLKGRETPPNELDFKSPMPKEFLPTVDLVVSANIVSQLSLEPLWYLSKYFGVKEDSDLAQRLIGKLGADHLDLLRHFKCPTFIYTDVTRDYISPTGELLETHGSRVPDLAKAGELVKSWTWDICPLGELSKEFSMRMTVETYRLK